MDGSLSSSRYGGGGGGGNQPRQHHHRQSNNRRRGGGGGSGRGAGYQGRQDRRDQPSGRGGGGGAGRRGGGGGGGHPSNRYGVASTTSVDPETAMLRQLGALLGKVGDVTTPPEVEGTTMLAGITKNIAELSQVLCSPANADKFLKFSNEPTTATTAHELAGPVAHLVISTVSTLPMQTPCYAGLTLAVHEYAPKPEYAGFASRCTTYAMRQFSSDIDSLLVGHITTTVEERSRTMNRLTLVLRYLTLLARASIVQATANNNDDDETEPKLDGLDLLGLLQVLTTASVKAVSLQQLPTAMALAQLVLNTLIYTGNVISTDSITDKLLEPLEQHVLSAYKSTFVPGIGMTALLLKEEQLEEGDDEGEEEEDEEDASGQRCDTLQDLFRSVKRLVQGNDTATQFSLRTDAPWEGLLKAPLSSQAPRDETSTPQERLVYKDEPLLLDVSQDCKSLSNLVLNGEESVDFQLYALDGIVFGRLPIFGSPPEDSDKEDDDDAEDMDTQTNEQLRAYQKEFGLLDRFFLADAVRDCLLCHQSHVSDVGLERGSAKDVAQQVWTVRHLFSQNEGAEYGIIEAILSLIMQSNNEGAFRNMYVGRVLLELTRLQPSIMAPALALGVSNVVAYYLPSLAPSARENFSCWFSFHLINTDYQWPAGYWEQWATYVVNGKRNSRGDFVLRTLSLMVSQSDVVKIATDCLPAASDLASYLTAEENLDSIDGSIASIQLDLEVRIWERNEDPDSLRAYMIGDEVSETIASGNTEADKTWCRTVLVVRALLQPATQEQMRQRQALQSLSLQKEHEAMAEDRSNPDDVLAMLTDNLVRYRPLLLATMARDAHAGDESMDNQGKEKSFEVEQLIAGELSVLKELENLLRHSCVLLEACVDCLVANEIVSGVAVVKWSLGQGESARSVVKRWWVFATIAIRVVVARSCNEGDAPPCDHIEFDGIMIDRGEPPNGGATATRRIKAIQQQVDPILKYTSNRVCHLLRNLDTGKMRLDPLAVDVLEGFKSVALFTKSLALSKLKGNDAATPLLTEKEAQDLWTESSLCGCHLASARRDQGDSIAVDALLGSLTA